MERMKKLKFIISLITQDNDYQRSQAVAASAAAERLGVDAEIIFADNDSVKQGLDLLGYVQAAPALRPNAIVLMPAGTALPHVARAAAVAEIGWAVLGKDAEYIPEL